MLFRSPCDIVKLPLYGLYGLRYALALHLFLDAAKALEPCLYAADGVAVMGKGVFLIQYIEFGFHLHHGAFVIAHQLKEGPRPFLQPLKCAAFTCGGKLAYHFVMV